jgi:hypothetical protein
MPMPDWFDPSMLGQMMPPGLLGGGPQQMAPGMGPAPPPGGGPPPPQYPPIPQPPALPGINPMAAAGAGAPLTPQQQIQALQNAAQAFQQIQPPRPPGQMGQAQMNAAMQNNLYNLGMRPGLQGGNLMQMLRGGLGAQRPPLMGGPMMY